MKIWESWLAKRSESFTDAIRNLVNFLEKVGYITTSSRIRFNVCLSSRHYPHISMTHAIQMTLEGQDGHVQDIEKYLNSELKAGHGKQPEAIREEILTRASGIFMWVVLVVQILNKEYDHGHIHALRRRLQEILDGLEKLFEDILTRDGEHMEELILCLQWILYARRPLKQEELYYAIRSGTEDRTPFASNFDDITMQDIERFILSCSKGLAETTKPKAQTVQFIHESVRDFLLGKSGASKLKLELGPVQGHECLKQSCCIYMKSDISEYISPSVALPVASSAEAGDIRRSVSERFPLMEYATRNVLFHANTDNGHGISQNTFVESFALRDWIRLDNLFERYQIRRHTYNASMLYISAEKNISNIIRIQLEHGSCRDTAIENSRNERYAAPLYAALANSEVSEDTVKALLMPVDQSPDGYREIQQAQPNYKVDCYQEAIETIIRRRPKVNPRKGQDLIGWAASEGHVAVVKLLLAKTNTELHLKHRNGHSPLCRAASNGHEALVKLLLSRDDVDPKFKNSGGRTPLSWAAWSGYEAV